MKHLRFFFSPKQFSWLFYYPKKKCNKSCLGAQFRSAETHWKSGGQKWKLIKLGESKWIKYLSPGTLLARWLALLRGTAHLTTKLQSNWIERNIKKTSRISNRTKPNSPFPVPNQTKRLVCNYRLPRTFLLSLFQLLKYRYIMKLKAIILSWKINRAGLIISTANSCSIVKSTSNMWP